MKPKFLNVETVAAVRWHRRNVPIHIDLHVRVALHVRMCELTRAHAQPYTYVRIKPCLRFILRMPAEREEKR